MQTLHIDIETRSDVKLKDHGVYRYVESDEFRVLMAGYSIDRGPVRVVTDLEEITSLPGLYDPTVLKLAHNAEFERVCLGVYGDTDPGHWDDTAARASSYGYPRSLDGASKALGVSAKDSAGSALIRFFCVPKRDGTFNRPEDHPEKWLQFCRYCRDDVQVLLDLDAALPQLGPEERRLWELDQRINGRGIAVDLELAAAAVEADAHGKREALLDLFELTDLDNPNSVQQLTRWLGEQGVDMPDMTADTVEEKLEGELPSIEAERALRLRQRLALTSSSKYTAAAKRTSADGRFRGAFKFFGAHTGRWSSVGVQIQNLPRTSIGNVEEAVESLKATKRATAGELKALIRPMFVGPLTAVDFAQIESRVLAWLAGEAWALEAFASGRDIYTETAERMGGSMTRQDGKVATLALGYAGSVGALEQMGYKGGAAKAKQLTYAWRDANPAIVDLWKATGEAFAKAKPVPRRFAVGLSVRTTSLGSVAIRLPSGRELHYHGVKTKMVEGKYGPRREITYVDEKTGARIRTYGGRLVENITQAVARDLLAYAMVNLDDAGYSIIGHVHDEVILEGHEDVDEVVEIMTELPEWAAGLPLAAEGFTADRYRK